MPDAFDDELRKLREEAKHSQAPALRFERLEMPNLMNGDRPETEWLVEDVWPKGRQIHIHAARKSGKSLVSLWMACNLALGRDPFTMAPIKHVRVGYWDHEMNLDDVLERIDDMGLDIYAVNENLNYYLHQPIAPLDTERGGLELLNQALNANEEAVFIDTMSRVISGDENSADTYINFYRHTGQPLKANGIAMSRLDHEGHEGGRSRGSSAKADDVDIVWQLKPTDDGLQFIRKAARMSWVPENVFVKRHEDAGLSYSRQATAYQAGTAEKAKEMDDAGVPMDAGRGVAIRMLKEAGFVPGKNALISAAIKYRKTRMIWP